MEVPPASHPIWKDLITGQVKIEFTFLAAKMLLARLAQNYQFDPSPEKLTKSCQQIRDMYASYLNLPSARADLQLLLKENG